MKKLIVALAAILFIGTKAQAQTATGEAPQISVATVSTLPDTKIKNLITSKKVPFNSIIAKDTVTVISFWATWCVPCKREIANINEKLKAWQAEVPFKYVIVSIDETRAEGPARTYVLGKGWEFPSYIDVNSDTKRSLNYQDIPYTIVVDKTGKIVYNHLGYEEGSENAIFEKIKELSKL